jgi:hypothetical protein
MSKSTNTVVYFDWKTVIHIYACGKCRTQFMLPMEKSVTFTGAYANEIIPSINRSFVYKAKLGRNVRILYNIQDYCVPYNNTTVSSVICEGWSFTCTWETLAWPLHFTERRFRPIKPTPLLFIDCTKQWNWVSEWSYICCDFSIEFRNYADSTVYFVDH